MDVDPQLLRAFGGQVDGVARVINRADLGDAVSTSGDGLPNSTTQWAGHAVGEHFMQMASKLAEDVTKTGQAVHGAGNSYMVADDALASLFDGLFG